MPTAPTVPTSPAVLSEERLYYEILRNWNYLAQLAGTGAPTIPTNPAVMSDQQLLYQILLNLNYWAVQAGGNDPAFLNVVNKTGGPLSRDSLVRVSGWDATAGAFTIVLADADASAGSGADFVLLAAIADNATGIAYRAGSSEANLNTNAGNVGDPVYLSTTAGGWSLTAPTGNDDIVQEVGTVAVKSATVGRIQWNLQNTQVIGTNNIQSLAVTGAKIAAGAFKVAVVAGGAAGDIIVTSIAVGDELVTVVRLDRDATAANINISDLTSEFTVGAGLINNAAGTNTTGDSLMVLWIDKTP